MACLNSLSSAGPSRCNIYYSGFMSSVNIRDIRPPMLLCLSYFIPGKLGRFVRRTLLIVMTILFIYFLNWILIVRGMKMDAVDQYSDKDYVYVTFRVTNDSYATVKVDAIDVKNINGDKVDRFSEDLPAVVPASGMKKVRVLFTMDQFKTAEVKLTALLTSYTIKTNL